MRMKNATCFCPSHNTSINRTNFNCVDLCIKFQVICLIVLCFCVFFSYTDMSDSAEALSI